MSKEDLVNNYGEMLVNTSTKLVEYQQDINRYRKPVFDTEDMMDAFEAGWDAREDADGVRGHIKLWKEEFLDKACEWLNGVIYDYMSIHNGNVDTSVYIDDNKFIEDFRKAMGD